MAAAILRSDAARSSVVSGRSPGTMDPSASGAGRIGLAADTGMAPAARINAAPSMASAIRLESMGQPPVLRRRAGNRLSVDHLDGEYLRGRLPAAYRRKTDAGPFPDRRWRRAVMAGCHYFSPVFVGLQDPTTTVLQLCPHDVRPWHRPEGANVPL